MSGHGTLTLSKFKQNWIITRKGNNEFLDSNYPNTKALRATHISGLPKDEDRYRGVTSKGSDEKNWNATKLLMSNLAQVMGINKRNEKDSNIPAGYTYLAQLLAHDLISTGTSFPSGVTQASQVINHRNRPLVLESLYGSGPEIEPSLYEYESDNKLRRQLRLGLTRNAGNKNDSIDFIPDQLAPDIPRIACPYMQRTDGKLRHEVTKRWYPTDNLLADSRNDDNVILSQLLTIFIKAHNLILSKADNVVSKKQKLDELAKFENFRTTRAIVVRIYRNIIRHDLLLKLLDDDVYQAYIGKSKLTDFVDEIVRHSRIITHDGSEIFDRRIPVEFSHAAFRFAHSMVHNHYVINDNLKVRATTSDILKFTSKGNPEEMPLDNNWIVGDWGKFFEIRRDVKPNYSRKIGPETASGLVNGSALTSLDQMEGGLIYRDLARGAEVGVRTVSSLIKLYGLDQKADYPFKTAKSRQEKIGSWINETRCVHEVGFHLSPKQQKLIENDPPLLFFILIEAAHVNKGEKLGPLGSMIMAETVFSSLIKTSEHDLLTKEEENLQDAIFEKPIQSMGSLISWIEENNTDEN